MATLSIPQGLIKEGFVVLPRREYEDLLKYTAIDERHESLWQDATKDRFFRSYGKSDTIYDQV